MKRSAGGLTYALLRPTPTVPAYVLRTYGGNAGSYGVGVGSVGEGVGAGVGSGPSQQDVGKQPLPAWGLASSPTQIAASPQSSS